MSRKIITILKNIIYYLIIICLIFIMIFVRRAEIQGNSMNPNFVNAENYFYLRKVDFQSKFFPNIKRFDVILIKHPRYEYIIKRVIGMPGEEIEYKNNVVYINDQAIDQPFEFIHDNSSFPKTKIAENHYFVMGDNRPNSTDSRFTDVDQISTEAIEGVSLKNTK